MAKDAVLRAVGAAGKEAARERTEILLFLLFLSLLLFFRENIAFIVFIAFVIWQSV